MRCSGSYTQLRAFAVMPTSHWISRCSKGNQTSRNSLAAAFSAYALSHPAEMESAMVQALRWDKTAQRRYNHAGLRYGSEVQTSREYAFLPMERAGADRPADPS